MKKYYLSLICVGVIIGCIGAAAGLSMMSSRGKTPDNGNNPIAQEEEALSTPSASDSLAPPPETEPAAAAILINPATKLIFESYNQGNSQTTVTNESPPYFLLGLPQNKVQEYYPEWNIVEFDSSTVKLHRDIPAETGELYVLGVKNNYVAVYQKSDSGSVSLKEMTNTPIDGLPQDEQSKLKSGISVQNEFQLSQMLEDYGS